MKTIELKIEGMHCKSCIEIIKEELAEMDGVSRSQVEIGKVTIEADGRIFDKDKLQKAIGKYGFKVL